MLIISANESDPVLGPCGGMERTWVVESYRVEFEIYLCHLTS